MKLPVRKHRASVVNLCTMAAATVEGKLETESAWKSIPAWARAGGVVVGGEGGGVVGPATALGG